MKPSFKIYSAVSLLALGFSLVLAGCSNPMNATLGTSSQGTQTKAATGLFNYGEALQKAILFYEAQRCGPVSASNGRFAWRADCHQTDGADVGVDLTGGWHDAGDHIKFNLPMSYSAGTLLWSIYENAQAYKDAGQYQALLDNIKYATDYLIKTHPSPNVIYYQVSNKSYDHNWTGAAEVFDPSKARPTYKLDSTKPGSAVAGDMAATFALGSIIYKDSNPAYAATLLQHAKDAYNFANTTRSDAGYTAADGMYNSWSGFYDELLWSATWLYLATGNSTYLSDAESFVPRLNRQNQTSDIEYKHVHCWDDKHYGAMVLLNRITGKAEYKAFVEKHLDWWVAGGMGYTPGGLAWISQWGSLRYASSAAFLAMVYARDLTDIIKKNSYITFAEKQINYILGDNPQNFSYMIGFGSKYPLHPHHRTSLASWSDQWAVPITNRHILYGALVGGPETASDTSYNDKVDDYESNEVATDYNAGLVGALSFMYAKFGGNPLNICPVPEVPDGPEFFNEASVNNSASTYTELKVLTNNRSAWPARYGKALSFRYFFDISELVAKGYSISNVSVATNYVEFPITKQIVQWKGNVYYVEVKFSNDTDLAPRSQSAFAAETQLRIQAPDGTNIWDPTNDFSYQGLASGNTSTALTQNIPVYSQGVLIYGKEPPREQDLTPPAAPTGLIVKSVSLNGAVIDWANNSEADLASYSVILGQTANLSDGSVVATPSLSEVTLSSLSAGTTYYLAVKAKDTSANVSVSSSIISFKTTAPDTTPPAAPTGLTVKSVSQNGAVIDWANNSEADLASYSVILGKTANLSDGSVVATPSLSEVTLSSLSAGTTYYLAVKAKDTSANVSVSSSIVSFKTTAPDTTPPATPSGLLAGTITSSSINLSWTANTEADLAGYGIYYALSPDFTSQTGTLAGSSTISSFSVNNLTANTTYYLRVLAKDTSANASVLSNALMVKTAQGATANIGATFFTSSTNPQTSSLGGRMVIKNNGTSVLSLADVKVKFYMNNDGKALNFWCDHAGGTAGNNYVSFTNAVTAPMATINSINANSAFNISFSSAAPSLLPGQFVEVQFRITTADWSNMNISNDWSLTDPTHLVIFYQGAKVSGIEP